jgi:hypothetical protein
MIEVSRHHGPDVIDQLATAQVGLVTAHSYLVEEDEAPLPGLQARWRVQGGLEVILPELRPQIVPGEGIQ